MNKMDRKEILKQAQLENKKADYPYSEAYKRGNVIGFGASIIIVGLLNFIESIIFGKANFGYMLIWFSGFFASEIYIFLKTKNKRDLIFSIIIGILTICFLVLYIVLTIQLAK